MSDVTALRAAHPDWFIDQQGKPFVLYRGLLALAHERGLEGITVTVVQLPTELNGMTAVCAATVQMQSGLFSDVGDASPSNVNRMIAAHLLRMASTRAKARALRDAVNVGVTAFEELGEPGSGEAPPGTGTAAPRRPSVAVQGAARVDEDAGRPPAGAVWPQNGGPIPDVDTLSRLPATDRQREALHKFGLRELPEGLTRKQASEMLSDAIARKGGQ